MCLGPWFSTDNLEYMGLERGVKETRIRLGREEGNISGGRLDRDKGIGVCVCVCVCVARDCIICCLNQHTEG